MSEPACDSCCDVPYNHCAPCVVAVYDCCGNVTCEVEAEITIGYSPCDQYIFPEDLYDRCCEQYERFQKLQEERAREELELRAEFRRASTSL